MLTIRLSAIVLAAVLVLPVLADSIVDDGGRVHSGRVKEVVLETPGGAEVRVAGQDLVAVTLDADRVRRDEHWLVATLRFALHRERAATKKPGRVGVYFGRGVFPPSAQAVVRRLDDLRRRPRILFEADVTEEGLDDLELLVVPGGWAPSMLEGLGADAQRALATWVRRGGRYLGICAGGYLACGTVVWEGASYAYPLVLVRGRAIGPVGDLAPWPTAAGIDLVLERGTTRRTLYAGGSAFEVEGARVLARYPDGSAAAIYARSGAGHVLLTGAHVEFVGKVDSDLLAWEGWATGIEPGDARLLAAFLGRLEK